MKGIPMTVETSLLLLGLALLATTPAGAQVRGEGQGEARNVFVSAPVLAGAQLPDVELFDVVAGFGGKVVTGAPYSAETVTEFVQTLADGNRIVRRSNATVHRDGQGRTRRELGLGLVGPLGMGDGEAPRRVMIDDPVAGVSWVLDPQARTARRQPRLQVEWTPDNDFTLAPGGAAGAIWHGDGGGHAEVDVRVEAEGIHVKREHVRIDAGHAAAPRYGTFIAGPESEAAARVESLGVRDFSGVSAEGERRVVTIPAGQIGNEQPIDIVTERWYSEELQTVVKSVRRDPRVGENSLELRQLRLGEPDPALFEVPADWKVEEGEGPGTVIIHERQHEPGS